METTEIIESECFGIQLRDYIIEYEPGFNLWTLKEAEGDEDDICFILIDEETDYFNSHEELRVYGDTLTKEEFLECKKQILEYIEEN